jgi:hypothetical protein
MIPLRYRDSNVGKQNEVLCELTACFCYEDTRDETLIVSLALKEFFYRRGSRIRTVRFWTIQWTALVIGMPSNLSLARPTWSSFPEHKRRPPDRTELARNGHPRGTNNTPYLSKRTPPRPQGPPSSARFRFPRTMRRHPLRRTFPPLAASAHHRLNALKLAAAAADGSELAPVAPGICRLAAGIHGCPRGRTSQTSPRRVPRQRPLLLRPRFQVHTIAQ